MEKYYQVLGVPVGAPEEVVQQAYRDLVQVWHPDRFTYNPKLKVKAEEVTKEINAAFTQLKQARFQYVKEVEITQFSQGNPSATGRTLLYEIIKAETPKAWFVQFERNPVVEYWMPKSQCFVDTSSLTIIVPRWLVEKNNLETYADEDEDDAYDEDDEYDEY